MYIYIYTSCNYSLETVASRLEAIASRLEAIASRLEAMASRLEAMASRLEAIASRLEAIASRLEAIASRLEAIASRLGLVGWRPLLLGNSMTHSKQNLLDSNPRSVAARSSGHGRYFVLLLGFSSSQLGSLGNRFVFWPAPRNKCLATSNRCHATRTISY